MNSATSTTKVVRNDGVATKASATIAAKLAEFGPHNAPTASAVAEFASRPYIRAALSNPSHPHSVLSFFCGFDTRSDDAPAIFRTGSFLSKARLFWFFGNKDYDDLCREAFSEVVRAAGRGELKGLADSAVQDDTSDAMDSWDSIDGRLARLILCDQLSRNCFRGTEEAFQYDAVGLKLASDLADVALSRSSTTAEATRGNEMFGSYVSVLAPALMHSEILANHEKSGSVVEWAQKVSPEGVWDIDRNALLSHKSVVERFGRYPHRNKKLGRETTEEERKWLEDVDNLPMWAKSQG